MLPFPKSPVGRVAWLSSAAAAITAYMLLVLTVKIAAPLVLGSRGKDIRIIPAEDLASTVRTANEMAAADYARQIDPWRKYLSALRSPDRLRDFVDRLTGYAQKFHYGVNVVYGDSGDQRVLASFRELVVDDRQLSVDLHAAVEKYEHFLAEQDRQILEAAGVTHAQTSLLQVTIPDASSWSRALEPVIMRAAREARLDVAREAGSWVAGDLLGNEVNKGARKLGWNDSKPGSLEDMLWGAASDFGSGLLIDHMTDPTERILKRLAQEMAQAEDMLLNSNGGLFAQLQQLKTMHEAARAQFLAKAARQ